MTTLEALDKVRNCKRVVIKAMGEHGALAQLQTLYMQLEGMEQYLESEAIDKKIPAIEAAREKLAAVSGEIREEIAELREVAENVADVAKAIKILTDIGKQAPSLGVLV